MKYLNIVVRQTLCHNNENMFDSHGQHLTVLVVFFKERLQAIAPCVANNLYTEGLMHECHALGIFQLVAFLFSRASGPKPLVFGPNHNLVVYYEMNRFTQSVHI